MAKANSPIRLQQELMQAAESTARRFHRSTAEQIEYWATLGQSVSTTRDPDILLSIKSGLAKLNVEPVLGAPIDPSVVFDDLEAQRASGSLAQNVSSSSVRYQASTTHPGFLESITQHGEVTVGKFVNGEFVPTFNKQEQG